MSKNRKNNHLMMMYYNASLNSNKRILDIFSTSPVYDVDGWYFIDKYGNKIASYGYAIEAENNENQKTTIATLNTYIPFDIKSNGFKLEIILLYKNNNYISQYLTFSDFSIYGLRIAISGKPYFCVKNNGTPSYKLIIFDNIILTSGIYYRLKFETIDGIFTIKVTSDINDNEYINATVDGVDLNDVIYENIITPSIAAIGGTIERLHGAILYLNILGNIFQISDGEYSRIIFSQNSNYCFKIANTNWEKYKLFWKRQNKYNQLRGGYSILSFKDKITGVSNEAYIPYINNNTIIDTILTNYESLIETNYLNNYSIQECNMPAFKQGSAISLPVNFVNYDYDNNFFDTENNPKIINYEHMPTQVNKQFFWDRLTNLVCYDKQKLGLKWLVNTNEQKLMSIGDSTASEYFLYFLKNIGITYSVNSQGGRTTEYILNKIQIEITNNPDYLKTYDYITISCGYNDYTNYTSLENLTSNMQALITLLKNNCKETTSILLLGMYNWKHLTINPNADPNLINSVESGLSYNIIRQMQQNLSIDNNINYIDQTVAGFEFGETADLDTIHIYSYSGGLKQFNNIYDKYFKLIKQ